MLPRFEPRDRDPFFESIMPNTISNSWLYIIRLQLIFAIDHRVWKIGLPVRSAVLKPYAGRLVVGWVTTSESLLLIVLLFGYFEAGIENEGII